MMLPKITLVIALCLVGVCTASPTLPLLPNATLLEGSLSFMSPTVAGPSGTVLITGHLSIIISIEHQMERFELSMPAISVISEGIIDFGSGVVYSFTSDGSCQVFNGLPLPKLTSSFLQDQCTFVWPAVANGQPADQWLCQHGLVAGPQVNLLATDQELLAETITLQTPGGFAEYIQFTNFQSVDGFPPEAFEIPEACRSARKQHSVRSLAEVHQQIFSMIP